MKVFQNIEANKFEFKKKVEKDYIKKFNLEKNLEREKRKLEWKKLNVIARDMEKDERLKNLKYEEELLKKTTHEMII